MVWCDPVLVVMRGQERAYGQPCGNGDDASGACSYGDFVY